MTTTDLTIREDQVEFTPAQVAALRQIGVQDASPADLAVLLHQAQRTGLDPFARQLYMIGRWDSRSQSVKQTIQTSIDGLRVVAARRAETMGVPLSISAALLADPRSGQWREVLPSGVAPLAAKVTVRLGQGTFEAVAHLDEYRQTGRDGKPMGLWGRMPATMLGKCAEALALRKACPMDLSGVYTSEEMQQADAVVAPPTTPSPASSPSAASAHAAPAPGPARYVADWLHGHSLGGDVDTLLDAASTDGMAGSPHDLDAWLTARLTPAQDTLDAEVIEEADGDE